MNCLSFEDPFAGGHHCSFECCFVELDAIRLFSSGVMNPGEELKMVTAKSPLVLSILRVRLRVMLLWCHKSSEESHEIINMKHNAALKKAHVKENVQVMAYELMWTPNCTSQGAKEGETLTIWSLGRCTWHAFCILSECTRVGIDSCAVLYWIHEDTHSRSFKHVFWVRICENLCIHRILLYTFLLSYVPTYTCIYIYNIHVYVSMYVM